MICLSAALPIATVSSCYHSVHKYQEEIAPAPTFVISVPDFRPAVAPEPVIDVPPEPPPDVI